MFSQSGCDFTKGISLKVIVLFLSIPRVLCCSIFKLIYLICYSVKIHMNFPPTFGVISYTPSLFFNFRKTLLYKEFKFYTKKISYMKF